MNTPARLCRQQMRLTLPVCAFYFLLRLLFSLHPVTAFSLSLLCAWLCGLSLLAQPSRFLWFHPASARMRLKKWAGAFLFCLLCAITAYFSLDFGARALSLPPGSTLATACGLFSLLFGQGVGCLTLLR